MIHQGQKQPLVLIICCVLFSCSSTASSFGTVSRRARAGFSSPTLQQAQVRVKTNTNTNTNTNTAPNTSTSTATFNSLLTRGGSDEMEEDTSTVLSAAADDNDYGYDNDNDNDCAEETDSGDASVDIPAAVAPPATTEVTTEVTTRSSPMGPNSAPPGFLRKLLPNFPWHTLPNQLTYARCVAIPALVIQFYTSTHVDKNIHSSLIFAIASLTDYLDGYLARRWDICSPFGAFLDPVADKLMVSTALILLTGKYGYIVAIPSAIILAREIAVSALREWMASKGKRDSVKVGFQGKVKTAATMVALTIIMSVPDAVGIKWNISQLLKLETWNCVMSVGMLLLFLSSFVTITSGSVYFKAAAPVLMGEE